MFVGILRVGTFGIEHSHGGRQFVVGHVMVANDEIDAPLIGVGHLVDGFDTTVERNDQRDAVFDGIVDAFVRNTVALVVPIGNIKIDCRRVGSQKLVDERYSRCTVYIIIPINQNLLFVS